MFENFTYYIRLNAVGYLGYHMSEWFYAGDLVNMGAISAVGAVVLYSIIEASYYSTIS